MSVRVLLVVGLALAGLLACTPPERIARPHILLVTLDTTRWDHLGLYGYGEPTSPELDRLARESVVYERAYSTSSWTLPSHASLFTGKYLSSHGASYDPEGPLRLLSGIPGPEAWQKFRARGLAEGEATLAEMLEDAGYRTGGIVAGPWLKQIFGLGRGFGHYDDSGIESVGGRPGREVADRAIEWIDEAPEEPFFLFLNFFDPHSPYSPPREEAALFPADAHPGGAELAAYDAEIRHMDAQLGRVLDHLRARGLWDRTWVFVTADHGELFGENGLHGHGRSLMEPEIRIPFVVKYPAGERAAARTDEPIQLTAILPMVTERLGLRADGRSSQPGPVLAQLRLLPGWTGGDWDVLLVGTEKLVRKREGGTWLYDLSIDPRERVDLSKRRVDRTRDLSEELDRLLASLPPPLPAGPAQEIDPDTRSALESLGYVE